jgi:hypothetical protein
MSIVSGDIFDRIDLVITGEYRRDQRDALGRGEGVTDQPFPGWIFTAHEKAVQPTIVDPRVNGIPTGRGESARLLKFPGANEVHYPSNVASVSTNFL